MVENLTERHFRSYWDHAIAGRGTIPPNAKPWVTVRLRFGRFLNFITGVINSENIGKGLTEGRFRTFWQLTDQSGLLRRVVAFDPSRLALPDGVVATGVVRHVV